MVQMLPTARADVRSHLRRPTVDIILHRSSHHFILHRKAPATHAAVFATKHSPISTSDPPRRWSRCYRQPALMCVHTCGDQRSISFCTAAAIISFCTVRLQPPTLPCSPPNTVQSRHQTLRVDGPDATD